MKISFEPNYLEKQKLNNCHLSEVRKNVRPRRGRYKRSEILLLYSQNIWKISFEPNYLENTKIK